MAPPSFLLPLSPMFWPFSNLAALFTYKPNAKLPPPKAAPFLDLTGNLTSMVACTHSTFCAYAAIYWLYEDDGYPAFGAGKVLSWSWMWPIIVRNLVATWVVCGLWDWILYFSPLKERLHKFKFNPKYPSFAQLKHDAAYTSFASVCAAAVEISLCHLWARGTLDVGPTLSERPVSNFLWIVLITHWRIPHFYIMHRAMHPWKSTMVPDLGKFLYKHVHALHHKSYNPTAFSGTNMHPVEATLYYTSCLIAVAFGRHPVIVLGCIADCAIGAWLGHDGFNFPGNGDYFHQLHHAHFDCNYGATHVPLDWLFGTYIGSKEELKNIWGNRKAGAEANETRVHDASAASNKVA